ncbi:alpha/beta hydrolase [Halopseudomonas nanhaiensis]|uniref:alpha/beta family hydrolase n=1 Tax=Halopseudomonas nanhaiensis TaxID=2830842 RepID=UPI001CBD2065|nr:alpha/beta family hydrolase [Halopseudomonas nanhaiensis]UAW97294.1 alpha/beta hydrolase [Halopseudomonas nanhaiensis]
MSISLLINEPQTGPCSVTMLLAHGAGAPMDSPFMQSMAEYLAGSGLRVARFEFPYMADRRREGRKRPPNPMPQLLDAYREAAGRLTGPLVLAGKSMGGRVASMLADELGALGLVCFGYPFHPPGKPEKTRVEHLRDIATPTLILQGTRDPLGRPEEVSEYVLASQLRIEWLDSGDHDFKPLKASGRTQQDLMEQAACAAVRFCCTQMD